MYQDDQQQGAIVPSHDEVEKELDELMEDFNLDENQAVKVKELEDAGYDEEDAVSQAQDME